MAATPVLPLLYHTPDDWAAIALADPLRLLEDHAHLEAKAANNALIMLTRWPGQKDPPRGWPSRLSRIAREEAEHLRLTVDLLERRGGVFTKHHRNRYAAELRQHVRVGQGPLELLDRLLSSALIEARSCERFGILARGAQDAELARFYGALLSSEAQHYRTFLALARLAWKPAEADRRWHELLEAEAAIAARQIMGPHIL